ncbi:MAG: hypothetical protein CL583_04310 [Alteromonadaceae bacterium]|nr:hypothetical protein [Alteromonadaceae bacterium]|tara:strand:+ start:379 stop:1140 length:762 start_codon:yes stop_codon:yes gene_type:complete
MFKKSDQLKLRVLTVNTHKGFTHFNRRFVLPELRDAVRAVSADVVFMQEVLGAHEKLARRHSQNWPDTPHYEFLADSIWHDYAYGRNAVYPDGHHGNALMSRFPVLEYENVDVSIGTVEKRGLLHCRIERPNNPSVLHAVCVHLGLRESHRQQQLALLCELVSSVPAHEPIIVAGDFNDWRGKAHGILRQCGLTDVFEAEFGAAPKTFPARFPLLRLDRIYVRGARSYSPVRLPNRPWSHLSDHAPLAAEVII